MNTTLIHLIFAAALLAEPFRVNATETVQPGTGLENSNAKVIGVLVEEVSPETEKRGLTRERIEARVNSVLRKSGLKPSDKRDNDYTYLYINVKVIGSSFSLDLFFTRPVIYWDGDTQFSKLGKTWIRGGTGISTSGTQFILDALGDHTEVFANEYLKANSK